MWWKSRLFLCSVCLHIMFLTIFSISGKVKAETNEADGFIIKADRVIGTGMTASIVKQETSTNDGKIMLRFHYDSATIYGMSLVKQVNSPKGPVSITLKADGPVTVKGMTVDTTAISFQGVCIKASEMVPKLAMENVVMVAHYMNNEDSSIKQLVLNTISGQVGGPQPGKLGILQGLGKLSEQKLDQEIERISKGHLPLTCEEGAAEQGKNGKITDPVNDVVGVGTKPLEPVTKVVDSVTKPLEPVTKVVDSVTKPLDPVTKVVDSVTKPLDPVTDVVDSVTKPLEPVTKVVDSVTKPLEPVTKPLEPVVKPVERVVKTVEPVVTDTKKKVEGTVQSVCERLNDAKGVISKELALNLIDEAHKKQVALGAVCSDNATETEWLEKWNDGLLKSLGLLDLLGRIKLDDLVEQLEKMRDNVSKVKDGVILFRP
ncbi:hypothetical protein E2K98_17160 [Bacillus salipaludis]|uniref:Uncharacterized protein n=1 Tax=Bacillus salipaludis TaxID=2547811 RepID=A0A4R5VPX3_9BACI|nr:hypothetical protein [Bacillus salipaludis]TDK59664.1 hypothetical protein E2K98_17160 [Bacillus salipaludis]